MDAARHGYREVAAQLREQIISGVLRPRDRVPTQAALAEEHGVSTAVINAAFSELARQGLVRVEHGKPTTVLEQRRYLVEMDFRPSSTEAYRQALISAATAAVAADPMIAPPDDGDIVPLSNPGWARVAAVVTAAHAGLAAYRLSELVRDAAGSGWDLAGAHVLARPV